MEGPLAEEFGLTLGEMRIGESRARRAQADVRARRRGGALVVHARDHPADQLGTSLGRILQCRPPTLGCAVRQPQKERAMKAPIKMLFPTVLFIFPAMFLIILGPAFLNLDKIF